MAVYILPKIKTTPLNLIHASKFKLKLVERVYYYRFPSILNLQFKFEQIKTSR